MMDTDEMGFIMCFVLQLGLANSEGVSYDFAGPYTINRDDM